MTCRQLLDLVHASHERPALLSETAFARQLEDSRTAEARYLLHELRRPQGATDEIAARAASLLVEMARVGVVPWNSPADDQRSLLEQLGRMIDRGGHR
jgi:hypothetical protein